MVLLFMFTYESSQFSSHLFSLVCEGHRVVWSLSKATTWVPWGFFQLLPPFDDIIFMEISGLSQNVKLDLFEGLLSISGSVSY